MGNSHLLMMRRRKRPFAVEEIEAELVGDCYCPAQGDRGHWEKIKQAKHTTQI